jgi:hypothetical protein
MDQPPVKEIKTRLIHYSTTEPEYPSSSSLFLELAGYKKRKGPSG